MNSSYSSSGTDCLLLSGSPCCWLKVWRASSSSSSSLEASSAAWLERAGGTATVPSAFWMDGFWQMYSGARPRLQISSNNCQIPNSPSVKSASMCGIGRHIFLIRMERGNFLKLTKWKVYLNNGGSGIRLESGLVPHELIHSTAEV